MVGSLVAGLVEDGPRLAAVARAAGVSGDEKLRATIEPLPAVLSNMTTEDLVRVKLGAGATTASVVVKIARSPRHSPLWEHIPPAHRERALFDLPWRAEPDIYASALGTLLPPGLRMPVIYAVDELGDERLAVWMESIDERATDWTAADYAAAARALGRLAGRLPEGRIPAGIPVERRDLRSYFFGRVMFGTMPGLRADASWSHELVAAAVDDALRADLEALAERVPALLDRLDALPRTFAHGDACPQNLLRPASQPDTVVAIDWTFAGICPIGMDAGQLLAGRAESGELDPADLPELFAEIADAYLGGLMVEMPDVDAAAARFGIVANLVVRSAFTALPVELLETAADAGLSELFRRRAGYARFVVDLANETLQELP